MGRGERNERASGRQLMYGRRAFRSERRFEPLLAALLAGNPDPILRLLSGQLERPGGKLGPHHDDLLAALAAHALGPADPGERTDQEELELLVPSGCHWLRRALEEKRSLGAEQIFDELDQLPGELVGLDLAGPRFKHWASREARKLRKAIGATSEAESLNLAAAPLVERIAPERQRLIDGDAPATLELLWQELAGALVEPGGHAAVYGHTGRAPRAMSLRQHLSQLTGTLNFRIEGKQQGLLKRPDPLPSLREWMLTQLPLSFARLREGAPDQAKALGANELAAQLVKAERELDLLRPVLREALAARCAQLPTSARAALDQGRRLREGEITPDWATLASAVQEVGRKLCEGAPADQALLAGEQLLVRSLTRDLEAAEQLYG